MGAVKHILVVDGRPQVRAELALALQRHGPFSISEAGSAAQLTALLGGRDARFDAVVLADVADSGVEETCLRLRRRGVRTPILVLSQSGDEAGLIAALDAGANDCLPAPARMTELAARLRAQIRAHESSEDVVLAIGPYQFRPAIKQLLHTGDNRRIRLTEKEAAVLKYLFRAGDKPVARRTLLHEVWGYNAGADTHTVETHIYRLRRKIEPDASEIGLLVNIGGGYMLNLHPRIAPARLGMTATERRHMAGEMLLAAGF